MIEQPQIEARGSEGPILFYDGECGFCNGMVRFVLDHEENPQLFFAPLQGSTAQAALKTTSLPPDIGDDSIVLYEKGHPLIRSRAAFRTMELMGGPWSATAKMLKLVPTPLADSIYRIVARIRKHLPKGKSCELLPPEQRKRFYP